MKKSESKKLEKTWMKEKRKKQNGQLNYNFRIKCNKKKKKENKKKMMLKRFWKWVSKRRKILKNARTKHIHKKAWQSLAFYLTKKRAKSSIELGKYNKSKDRSFSDYDNYGEDED